MVKEKCQHYKCNDYAVMIVEIDSTEKENNVLYLCPTHCNEYLLSMENEKK